MIGRIPVFLDPASKRCILEIARTEFCPRPPAAGSGREGKMNYEAESINNFKFFFGGN